MDQVKNVVVSQTDLAYLLSIATMNVSKLEEARKGKGGEDEKCLFEKMQIVDLFESLKVQLEGQGISIEEFCKNGQMRHSDYVSECLEKLGIDPSQFE